MQKRIFNLNIPMFCQIRSKIVKGTCERGEGSYLGPWRKVSSDDIVETFYDGRFSTTIRPHNECEGCLKLNVTQLIGGVTSETRDRHLLYLRHIPSIVLLLL